MMDERMMFELVKRTAAAIGYKPDSMPMRSTVGTSWMISSRRDYLEIQIHFNLDGSADLAVLSLDLDSQEDMGTIRVREGAEVVALVRAAKKLRAGAMKGGLSEHLRLEHGLNAGMRAGMKKEGCTTCGCGLVADSLIAPMSAEDKDAEAGPKEGPPMMVQPLRARRDYGSIASRVAMAQQYSSVNDAAEATGNIGYGRQGGSTEIWYMKPAFFHDGMMGFDSLREDGKLPDPRNLGATHVHLGRIRESDLEMVFGMMQGESWSPMGQANHLIRGKGLHHTSMSTGDVVEVGGRAYLVDRMGFEELPLVTRV